ncbi:DNA alkylation repair protein [Peptostreptococcus sp.]|uniref:DNA alkylation repair protein n=1 Tax=Peptostreptococcus sp. TaxID=1262 RepID=UPI001CB6777F|nr:DNA alkylation repair protein [Peptostreptococcus sp.]MBF1049765.1 DNA alkylation repair protein [Peptostreptococcus sp.]
MKIYKELQALKEKEYADFQAKLVPTIEPSTILGIRVPKLRALAKSYIRDQECQVFLDSLPHNYYDENMLHAILISEMKDYDKCINRLEAFLPYVDNWAVCDIMSPKLFKRYRGDLMTRIKVWIASEETYTIRFGLGMLMAHFLDEDFRPEYLDMASSIRSDEYYVNMMIAWFFATALAKQWEVSLPYIEDKRLDDWTHKKAIQKARESLRISKEKKEYLKGLK